MPMHHFDLGGGHPVLNFLNTMSAWTGDPAERLDYLPDFRDAIRMGRAIGLLSAAEAGRLARMRGGETEVSRLHELRARLERVFRRLVDRRQASGEDLAAVIREAAAAGDAARLYSAPKGRLTRSVDEAAAGASVLRYRLADRAVDLLTSDMMARVKTCPSCGWFFLDTSKNRSRRWCSMATCGSSAKARAYYRRRTGAST